MVTENASAEILEHILPLSETALSAVLAAGSVIFTYVIGRKKSQAELENLKQEKKNMQASSDVSTAEAASIVSSAAATTVQPLLERIKEQREDIKFLTDRNVSLRDEVDTLRITAARLRSENEILSAKLKVHDNLPEVEQ